MLAGRCFALAMGAAFALGAWQCHALAGDASASNATASNVTASHATAGTAAADVRTMRVERLEFRLKRWDVAAGAAKDNAAKAGDVTLLMWQPKERTWQEVGPLDPQSDAFPVRLPAAGEYWFCMRVAAADGAADGKSDGASISSRLRLVAELPAVEVKPVTQAVFETPRGGDATLIAGERPQFIRSRSIPWANVEPLIATLNRSGQDGSAAVVYWCTADHGNTWRRAEKSADPATAIDVTADGPIGWSVRHGSEPPSSDESPAGWIVVDTQPPHVRSFTAEGTATEGRAVNLRLHWEADDPHLTKRPITIRIAPTPTGPWSTLAAGLPRQGNHQTPLDPRWPATVHLRLEAQDTAGHITTADTSFKLAR